MIRSIARSWLTLEQWINRNDKRLYTKEEILSLMKDIFQIEVDNTFLMDMDKAIGGNSWIDEVINTSRTNSGEEG